MTNTNTSFAAAHRAGLEHRLAFLDQEIAERQHEIQCLQNQIDDCEAERLHLLNELKTLKMTIDIVTSFTVNELEESDPAVDARIEDVTRAITELQEEIAGVLKSKN
jgi:chromosome segregation ATPase